MCFFYELLKRRMGGMGKGQEEYKTVQYFIYFFKFFFRFNRDLIFFYFYGVLLVCNLYYIGVHTMDISGGKVVISNTKWESLGRLGSYH